jgi:hypothetical protein
MPDGEWMLLLQLSFATEQSVSFLVRRKFELDHGPGQRAVGLKDKYESAASGEITV